MTKKINTWEIADAIYEGIQPGNGQGTIFEDLSFNWDTADGSEDDTSKLNIWIYGEIEHPMSGYGDSYNTAINVEGEGNITPDGKIYIKGTYKMEVGTAIYIDELDELRKIENSAEIGEEQTFEWTSDDAEDFVDGLAEIPQ